MTDIDVTIRPLEEGDAEAVQRYASDERVAGTSNIPHPYPENGGEIFVKDRIAARKARERFAFAILADGELVGVIGLNKPDFENRTIQCDYSLAFSHWGRGFGTRAVALAVDYAFGELGMETICSACLARNPASRRVLEKNGFALVETFTYSGAKWKNEKAYRLKLTREVWETKNSRRGN